jgi:hypothetical protein
MVRLQLFDTWLTNDALGDRFVYHRGELARDAAADPDLAAVAAKVRALSTGRFDEVSVCGHVRGETIGSGKLEIVSRREHGEIVHLARRRA